MLKQLRIKNLAIIDELNLEFEGGFSVLTGETGAGKSIILSGINLLIGEKASVDMIREGEDKLYAQGVFSINKEQKDFLNDLGIETEEDEIIIRRSFDRNSKNKLYANGIRINLGDLKNIMSSLVDIVGQHSHQMLLNKSNHMRLLDSFLSKNVVELKEKLSETVKLHKELNTKILSLETEKKNTLDKKEFYEYQLEELEKLKLKEGEDEELEVLYKRAFNSEKIKEGIYGTLALLKNDNFSSLSTLLESKRKLEYLSKYDENYEELVINLENIYYDLESCVESIEAKIKNLHFEEDNLERITNRMSQLKSIKSKYKKTLAELIIYRDSLKVKLTALEGNDFELKKLEKEKLNLETEYHHLAKQLHEFRVKIANKIEIELEKELKFLNMDDAKLKIIIEENLEKISVDGYDEVEFLISTNLGNSLKSLSKIASGGEVSRVMLALKVIFSKVDKIPILIFDEIDTGVGGETIRKIALKLNEIAKNTQIISITHSPVIAAKAKQQFYIEKFVKDGRTSSNVRALNSDERVLEISRMLVGEKVTNEVLEIAKKILEEV